MRMGIANLWVSMYVYEYASTKATHYSIKTSIYVTIYYSLFIGKLPIINYEFFAFVQCVTSSNLKALEIGIRSSNLKMHRNDYCADDDYDDDDNNKECDNNAVFMCEHKLRETHEKNKPNSTIKEQHQRP